MKALIIDRGVDEVLMVGTETIRIDNLSTKEFIAVLAKYELIQNVEYIPYAEYQETDVLPQEMDAEYWEIEKEKELIERAERETFRELNGFSDEEDAYIAWKYGVDNRMPYAQ